MAAINFYLRTDKASKSGMHSIIARMTFNGLSVKKSTGIRILEKHWNEKKQRIKPNLKSEPSNQANEYNIHMDEMEKKARDIFNYALLHNIELTTDYFNQEWSNKYYKSSTSKDIFEYFKEFIEVNRSIRAKRTITGYNTAYNFLNDFKEKHGVSLTFENFDLHMFEKLRSYAFEYKNCSDNYFSALIKRIKVFLGWAMDREYHNNLAYTKFKAPEKPKEIICLYKDELFQLYNYQFKNKRLERVKDTFCFGCFTGLRFSDLIDLKREHIKGDEIQKVIVKTREFARIPLNKFALEILEKFKDVVPGPLPKISQQKFNDYIKECCQIAKIHSPVSISRYFGGKVIQETYPKYQLITSHTARKTFTTNSLIFGMKESVVKKITGHKQEENFRRYVNLAEDYVKEASNAAWNNVS